MARLTSISHGGSHILFDWCMDGICRVVLLERLEGRGCFFGRMQLLVVIHSVALATTQLLALHVDDCFFSNKKPIKTLKITKKVIRTLHCCEVTCSSTSFTPWFFVWDVSCPLGLAGFRGNFSSWKRR